MANQVVQVPVSVLLNSEQTPATKVVWTAARLHPTAGPADLSAKTGLHRVTVLTGLSRAAQWNPTPGGPRVKVPGNLLTEHSASAQAKVLYGLLQTIPTFRGHSGEFTYSDLSSLTGLSRNTRKRAMADLVGAKWIQVTQKSRVSPIRFTLGSPELIRSLEEASLARRDYHPGGGSFAHGHPQEA